MEDEKMINEICEAISFHTPYGPKEIKRKYKLENSFDKVLWCIETAQRFNCDLFSL